MQDFNQYKINPLRMYGGANGNKIAIIINDENYMLKFPSKVEHNSIMSYSNSPVTEHIGCQIGRLLGFNVQETIIGTYSDKTVVACKDFEQDGYRLQEFALLKN